MSGLQSPIFAVLIMYLQGYTRDEIAKKLGISQGEVSARIKIMLESLAEGQDLVLVRPLLKAIRKHQLTLADVAQAVYQNALLERLQMTAADLKKIDGVLSSIEQDPKLVGLSPLALLIQAVDLVADYTAKEGSDGNHPPLEELPAYFQMFRKEVADLKMEKRRILKLIGDKTKKWVERENAAKQNLGSIQSQTTEARQILKETQQRLEAMQTREKAELLAISVVKDALSKGYRSAQLTEDVGILASVPKEELEALRAKYGSKPSEPTTDVPAKTLNIETPISEAEWEPLLVPTTPQVQAAFDRLLDQTVGNPEWREKWASSVQFLNLMKPLPSTILDASLEVESSQLGGSKDVANDPAPREQPSDPSPYPANDKE